MMTRCSHINRMVACILILTPLYSFGPGQNAVSSAADSNKYGGGSGEAEDPYLIYTAQHMNTIGTEPLDWDKHFKLMADIDLAAFDGRDGRPAFNIIAPDTTAAALYQGKPFSGSFDGNGHTIAHLTLTGRDYQGLFGQLELTAQVRNLGLVGVNISGSGRYVGALSGGNFGLISRCYSTGRVHSSVVVGGLAGYNSGVVTLCYSTAAVSGGSTIGGLLGDNGHVVTQCYSTGSVDGTYSVGGLIGYNGYAYLTQCYSTGRVSGTDSVGGLIGESIFSSSFDCFWDIETSGQAGSADGIGLTTAEMQESRTYGNAGWDWIDEMQNGASQVWLIPTEGGYPVLAIFQDEASPPLQGSGTTETPYLIDNALDLGAMVYYDARAYYQLTGPIDLSGVRWTAAAVPCFAGVLDGNGFAISNLTTAGGDYAGVFGRLTPAAQVRDLGIVDVNIANAGNHVGALAGWNFGLVARCRSTGTVSGLRSVGGLVGYNWGAVAQSYSACAVTGLSDIGGLVGYHEYGEIMHCYSTGEVMGTMDTGGLAGRQGDLAVLTQCFWDTQTSGQALSAGGIGLATDEMQTADTFLAAGWDFVYETNNGTDDIWYLQAQQYPKLYWEPNMQMP